MTSTSGGEQLRPRNEDRDSAVERVKDAYAVGQISYQDLDGRLHSVLTAPSRGELLAAQDSLPAPEEGRSLTIVATSGRIRRRGAWRIPRVLRIESEFGPVELDLSRATFETPVVDLELQLRFGRAKVTVPPDAVVDIDDLRAVWKQPDYEAPAPVRPGGPLIRISGAMEYGRLRIRHARR